jgi:hypothetical protein
MFLKSNTSAHRSIAISTLILFLLAAVTSCNTTKLVDVWKEPNYTGGPLKNIIVIGVAHDLTTKRTFEDIFCQALKDEKIKATPSYSLFPEGAEVNKDMIRAKVKEGGYDGVILTRLVGKDEQTTYTPGMAYSTGGWYGGGYYGAYGYGYGVAYSPGYVTTQQIFRIQTTLWAAQDDGKLIWTGTSETVDPQSAKSTSEQLTRLVTMQLVQSKLI